ncbi:unnamed protein product [Caretta caretta]
MCLQSTGCDSELDYLSVSGTVSETKEENPQLGVLEQGEPHRTVWGDPRRLSPGHTGTREKSQGRDSVNQLTGAEGLEKSKKLPSRESPWRQTQYVW